MGFHEKSAMPDATAARASTGMNSRCPPEAEPCPPGNCTECVASNTTGQLVSRMIASERMSETRLLYPKEKPRSQTMMFGLPVERALSTTFFISTRQELALLDVDGLALAATFKIKFVCRHRNAGVCRTSTTAATSSIGVSSCTSVNTGTPSALRISARIFSPASIPGPR